ncbi:hypothetical protein ACIPMZ_20905 [Scandinavium goeteborgense]|uniref:hypothetical protein n=1 Tax=Scandinavium goeteborgense TaxID=1851514 RepID=UPI003830B775
MHKLLLFFLLVFTSLAHAAPPFGAYQGDNPRYGKNTLVISPDTFKNRIRYYFVSPNGDASVYLVAEKIGPGKYREINVNADGEASQLIINGDSATLQSRYVGKVVDSIIFMKK